MPNSLSYVLRLIIIAILLGCLARMPYGYYQFVRLSTCIMFLVLAYNENEKKKIFTMLMCIGFAILFNPILKIYFTRATWNGIDVVVAGCVGVWLAKDIILFKKNTNKQ